MPGAKYSVSVNIIILSYGSEWVVEVHLQCDHFWDPLAKGTWRGRWYLDNAKRGILLLHRSSLCLFKPSCKSLLYWTDFLFNIITTPLTWCGVSGSLCIMLAYRVLMHWSEGRKGKKRGCPLFWRKFQSPGKMPVLLQTEGLMLIQVRSSRMFLHLSLRMKGPETWQLVFFQRSCKCTVLFCSSISLSLHPRKT